MNTHTLRPISIVGAFLLLPLSLEGQTTGKTISSKTTENAKPAAAIAGPNEHLRQARAFFDQRKMEESSAAIFKAIDSIHKRMLSADSLPTEGAMKASNRLDILANRVSEGKVRNGRELDRQFAKVNEEMAVYYAELARVAAREQKPQLTRSALGRSANYLENVAAWTGQKLGEENQRSIRKMRELERASDKAGKTVSPETRELVKKTPVIIEHLRDSPAAKSTKTEKGRKR